MARVQGLIEELEAKLSQGARDIASLVDLG
jgi:hypothetical protein